MRDYTSWQVEEVGRLHHDKNALILIDSKKCNDVTLNHALEVAWGIENGSLVARSSPLATDLRLTHYAEIDPDQLQPQRNTCIAPHTDLSPVTPLLQDNTGGLEIEDRTDTIGSTFVPLPPTDTTEMISMVVDTLTRWTNG
ncbi:hypothetical protein ACSS6W_002576 [Trichoderma asperelloides]